MAPEQARGDTKFVGPQADVYSLGVILYVCLTGTKPFKAPDAIAMLRKVAEEEPERPGKRIHGLPRDIELICLKCLAKNPAERYQTAKALAEDLGRFAGGEPVSVRAAGVAERVAKWARRKPTLAAAYGLTALSLLFIGLVAGAVWLWQRAEGARDQAEVAKTGAEMAKSEAENARDGEKEARAVAVTERKAAEGARDREEIARKGEEVERKKSDVLAKRLEVFEYGRTMQVAHQEWRENNVAATLALLDSTPKALRG